MGNYEELKQAVVDVIKSNGNQEITGDILQSALLTIISTIGDNATFAGVADLQTNPGTPDQNIFWILAKKGTYNNFGGVNIKDKVVFAYNKNNVWNYIDSGIATINIFAFKQYNYTKNEYVNSLIKEIHIDGIKNERLKYYVRSCERLREGSQNAYFAIQSYNPLTEERITICEFSGMSKSGCYEQKLNNYKTRIYLTIENQTTNDGAISSVPYSEDLEINDNCWDDLENAPIIDLMVKKNFNSYDINRYNNSSYGKTLTQDMLLSIPIEVRKNPAFITYRDYKYIRHLYIYRGVCDNAVDDSSWSNLNNWTKILDEEDLKNNKQYPYTKNAYANSLLKEIHIDGVKNESLKYFMRSCIRYRSSSNYFYFAIQSYDPNTTERVTICEFDYINQSGFYQQERNGYITSILVELENQNGNDEAFEAVPYSEGLEINDNCWGEVENAPIIKSLSLFGNSKNVDLIMFMGQSNMAGRGITTLEFSQKAPEVIVGAGYEYRAITDPNNLHPIIEPFGVNENKSGGINEPGMKTGSMVSAFVNSYYETTRKKIIAVSASKGGTKISEWQPGGNLLTDAIQRLNDAKNYLNGQKYKVEKIYMAWCQGESNGDVNTNKENYKSLFKIMFSKMKENGVTACFLVRIGKYNGSGSVDYTNIIEAQTELCKENADIIMASTALASFKEKGLMKDNVHYYQQGYNLVGTYAGRNSGLYRLYGTEKPQYDDMTNELYISNKCY